MDAKLTEKLEHFKLLKSTKPFSLTHEHYLKLHVPDSRRSSDTSSELTDTLSALTGFLPCELRNTVMKTATEEEQRKHQQLKVNV